MSPTVYFAVSAICFITTFESHMMLKAQPPISWPAYMSSPLLNLIPKVSGFILAVIPECFIFDIAWYWMFLINAIGISILGPFIGNFLLAIFVRDNEHYGISAFVSFIIAIISLILGL